MSDPADQSSDKPARKKLSRRFKIVAASAALAVTTTVGGAALVFGTATGAVPLTPEEVTVAQSLFGPNFRTDDVRKHYVRAWFRDVVQFPSAMVPLSNRHIYFFSSSLNVPDLTTGSGSAFETYMHEMTHVWQHRGNWAPICRTYDYTLTPRSTFGQFCNEQQASMVGDYARLFLNPNSRIAVRKLGDATSNREGNDNLMRVVERQFPHARQSRLTHEARFRSIHRCIVSYSVTFNQASGDPSPQDQRVIDHCYADPTNRTPLPDVAPPAEEPTLLQRIFGLPRSEETTSPASGTTTNTRNQTPPRNAP